MPGAAGGHQLVLLDHGLYRRIDDAFRLEYAALWAALLRGDREGIKRHSAGMNAGDAYPIFATMLTQRPWEQVSDGRSGLDRLVVPTSRTDRAALAASAAEQSADITALLQRMPRALLMLLKTNDCLRSVDVALGRPMNSLGITARECHRALADAERARGAGRAARARLAWEGVQIELRMLLVRLLAALWGGGGGGGGGSGGGGSAHAAPAAA
jgi:aarF domain-containing kinase